jgi:hypothetical protein
MVSPYKKKACLSPIQGRPISGAGSTISEPIKIRILYYRGLYPSWGAKTIVNELLQVDGFELAQLPHIRTINRYLKSKSLTAKREKHEPLPNNQNTDVSCPHQRWQMDDKGPELYKDVGHVGMINIKDQFSSVYIQSFGVSLPHTRSHPDISDYQCALRLAFSEFGLPKSIQADHGSNRGGGPLLRKSLKITFSYAATFMVNRFRRRVGLGKRLSPYRPSYG